MFSGITSRCNQQFREFEKFGECGISILIVARIEDLHDLIKTHEKEDTFHLRKRIAYRFCLLHIQAAIEEQNTRMWQTPLEYHLKQMNPIKEQGSLNRFLIHRMLADCRIQ